MFTLQSCMCGCGEKRKRTGGVGVEKRRKMGVDQWWSKRIGGGSGGGGVNMDSLPDDALLNILGRLKFIDAATTALVSPRLLNVWTFSTHLDFKDDADPDPDQSLDLGFKDDDEYSAEYSGKVDQPSRGISGIHFMKFVNFILNRHRASSVDSLRIAFDAVGIEGSDHVLGSLEKWVEFASLKSVRSLEIDLHHSARGTPATSKSPFWFPLHELYGLSTLTSLSLKFVSILDEDDIVYLLERSLLNLETLVIENASRLRNLKIKAQKLKHLEISYCPDLRSICIISAPNLQSFAKAADFKLTKILKIVHVSLGSSVLPKLTSVSLRGLLCPNLLLELQEYSPLLEKLELDICEKQFNFGSRNYPKIHPLFGNILGQFPHLKNIKQLVLNFCVSDVDGLMDLTFILAGCPNLQDLTLKYVVSLFFNPENDGDRHWGKPSSYTHTSLRTVTFVGWSGSIDELKFASYLMEIATNLQMVSFDTNPVDEDCYMGYREWPECNSWVTKYDLWQIYLSKVEELIDSKPDSVAFRYAVPRISPEDLRVSAYEDWEEECWMMNVKIWTNASSLDER